MSEREEHAPIALDATSQSSPRVFISYTHEGRDHHEQVRRLADLLGAAGITPALDQSEEDFAEGLPLWMTRQIEAADYVLVICTETYARIVLTGDTSSGGRGALFEFFVVANYIHTNDSRNIKVIPVGFGPHDLTRIPTLLQPAIYYDVSTTAGFEQLVYRLRRAGPPEPSPPGTAANFIETNLFSHVAAQFRTDVALLAEYSGRNFETRIKRSTFNLGDTPIQFERSVSDVLSSAAALGSILVTGEPGSGKSAVIHHLCDRVRDAGHDFVYFDVERNDAQTPYDLRKRIGLQHEIDDVLAAWTGEGKGFLFIDALDALRSGESARAFRDLLSRIALNAPRWHCIVAIRSYDLANSPSLRAVFPLISNDCIPQDFTEPIHGRARHVTVDRLSLDDLAWLATREPRFAHFYESASGALLEIIRNPFNLSLAATILGSAAASDRLHAVHSTLELLDLYWQHRVIEQDRSDPLEHCLADIAQSMIEKRALFTFRLDASDALSVTALLQLGILSEFNDGSTVDRYRISFRHTILFDYAIQRVIFRAHGQASLSLIERDRDIALFLQPSLRFYFQYLWFHEESRHAFWAILLWLSGSSSAPEFIKLHASMIACVDLQHAREIDSLFQEATGNVERVFRYLVRAISSNSRDILRERAAIWLSFLQRIVAVSSPPSHECYLLLDFLRAEAGDLRPQDTLTFNHVSRALLSSAMAQKPRFDWYVRVGLLGVLRSYAANSGASRAMLRGMLSKNHLREYGFRDAPIIASEISQIIPTDPTFAVRIYTAVFGFNEKSHAKTSIGSSRIFGFSSNRAQDYGMATFELARAFPSFLSDSPGSATAALCAALDTYDKRIWKTETRVIAFTMRGLSCSAKMVYAPDGDRIDDPFRHDDPLKMIDAFDEHFAKAAQAGDIPAIETMLDAFARYNTTGYLLRRVLLLGHRFPATIGIRLSELLASADVLTFYDSREAAAKCLEATFSYFDVSVKETIEDVIASLGRGEKAERRKYRLRVRDDLLQALPPNEIVRSRTQALRRKAATARLAPTVVWHGPTTTPYTVLEAYDEEVGVTGGSDPLREGIVSVENIWRTSLNQVLDERAIREYLPKFVDFRDQLAAAQSSDGYDFAWSVLAAGISKISQSPAATRPDKEACLPILLAAASQRDPKPDRAHDKQFNSSQSWGSPSARIDAALALLQLHQEFPDRTFIALRRLAKDKRAVVRFLIARWVGYLSNEPEAWRMAEAFSRDANRGVLVGLLDTGLRQLFARNWQRAIDLVWRIFQRVNVRQPGAESVRKLCILYFASASLYHGDRRTDATLTEILETPERDLSLAKHVVECYLNTAKQAKSGDHVRAHCLSRICDAAVHCRETFQDLTTTFGPWGTWPAEASERLKAVFGLAAFIAERVYFLSGAVGTVGQVTRELDVDFFEGVLPAIEVLVHFAEPNTVQHVVQTISAFAIVDPKRLFELAAVAIKTGVEGGYALEYMAADAVAAFMRQYLADFRELLESDATARGDLMDILDIFVRAGWPQMNKIVDDLQALFR